MRERIVLLSVDLVFPLCIQNGYLIFEALKRLVFALIVIIIIITRAAKAILMIDFS